MLKRKSYVFFIKLTFQNLTNRALNPSPGQLLLWLERSIRMIFKIIDHILGIDRVIDAENVYLLSSPWLLPDWKGVGVRLALGLRFLETNLSDRSLLWTSWGFLALRWVRRRFVFPWGGFALCAGVSIASVSALVSLWTVVSAGYCRYTTITVTWFSLVRVWPARSFWFSGSFRPWWRRRAYRWPSALRMAVSSLFIFLLPAIVSLLTFGHWFLPSFFLILLIFLKPQLENPGGFCRYGQQLTIHLDLQSRQFAIQIQVRLIIILKSQLQNQIKRLTIITFLKVTHLSHVLGDMFLQTGNQFTLPFRTDFQRIKSKVYLNLWHWIV